MVACEYWGIQILDAYPGFEESWKTKALEVLALAAKDPYLLGTDQPDEMEVINWDPTNIDNMVNKGLSGSQLLVRTDSRGSRITFTFPQLKGERVDLSIIDIHGRKVWAKKSTRNRIVWHSSDLQGKKVSSGMYVYKAKAGKRSAQGKIAVK
jgi:hypothetical protein